MGMCQSAEGRAQMAKNTEIEKELAKEMEMANIKLLLLGAGECGKSTILKQMQILHLDGFSEAEIKERRDIIYSNVITSMVAILEAMQDLEIALDDPEREIDAKIVRRVLEVGEEKSAPTNEVSTAIQQLWSDMGVIDCFGKRHLYQLPDCAKYFFDELDRIKERGYRPTNQDILQSRVATLGIVEVIFVAKATTFRVFDVGGQRSERRKWIHCFDNVQAVIFIASLSEYDQMLIEDATRNRMKESMELFKSILHSQWFANSSMILFLNKKDLFATKIQYSPLTVAFPEFVGSQTYERCVHFVEDQYKQLNSMSPNKRALYMHVTCATDTNQVQIVLDSVLDMVIQKNIERSGMD